MTSRAITVAEIKRAIEGHDAKTLAAFYADDALVRIIDRDNPPSKPRELKGKRAIAAYFDDVCGRAMLHKIGSGVSDGDALAFTEVCTYPRPCWRSEMARSPDRQRSEPGMKGRLPPPISGCSIAAGSSLA